ncbi:MAG: starvation-inducible outer membrane lipoprotein [Saprospiraceae bacterium]|jgi:starvation-inducible outer membrane lipoprotein
MKQTHSISLLILGLAFLSLTACQTAQFDETAKGASYDAPNVGSTDTQIGDRFIWGGQILEVKNEADSK